MCLVLRENGEYKLPNLCREFTTVNISFDDLIKMDNRNWIYYMI